MNKVCQQLTEEIGELYLQIDSKSKELRRLQALCKKHVPVDKSRHSRCKKCGYSWYYDDFLVRGNY